MIVRLSRARLRRDREDGAFEFLRKASSAGPKPPGMEAMFIGRRTSADADEIVAITVWHDLDALISIFGPSWSEPSFFPELDDAIIDASVEHFETIAERYEDLSVIGLEP
jgi:predicted TIM-barrel fold metal-dependent hydrolase